MNQTQTSGAFPSTHWSIVAKAAAASTPENARALSELLRRYRSPLVAHVGLRFPATFEDAEDLVHSFIEKKVLQKDLIQQANQQRGRFRTFLLESLDNFVRDQFRRQQRQKRKAETVPLHELADQEHPQLGSDATESFDRNWVRAVIEQALERMKKECHVKGRANLWDVFEARLLRPVFEGSPPPHYRQLIQQFGFRSPIEAGNMLTTAKRMFHRNLRSVVGEYVVDPRDIEQELRELQAIAARAP